MKSKKFFATLISMVLCIQMLPSISFAAETSGENKSISGNGIKVTYSSETGSLTLYRVDGATELQMSKPSTMGYPIVGGQAVQDFTPVSCVVEDNVAGLMGNGERMTIISQSTSAGLTRTYVLETSDTVEGAIYTTTSYQAGEIDVTGEWFVDNAFELYNPADRIWSYNGGGEGPMHYYDTIQKIDLTDANTFTRENKQDHTAASIPVADIYSADGGITVAGSIGTAIFVGIMTTVTENSSPAYGADAPIHGFNTACLTMVLFTSALLVIAVFFVRSPSRTPHDPERVG